MLFTQAQFDSSPLLIQQGALYLWGVYINAHWTSDACQAVYRLGEFYVAVTQEQGQWVLASFTDPNYLRLMEGVSNLPVVDSFGKVAVEGEGDL